MNFVAKNPITDKPTLSSEPLGDWEPCSMEDLSGRSGATFVFEPAFYALAGRTLEVCTGSRPRTYHVRPRS